ncbi:MAG: YceI family protein [Solirubrobacteraceae bacterium]|jgi:polyisoprenoid-binding protein YceI
MPTATTIIPAGTWTADPAHSTLGFSVKHLGIATVRGSFGEFEGKLELGDDLAAAKISGSAKAASVNTAEPQRDAHLKSADFFDAETHPELTFESTAITTTDDESFEIVGDLTMHGETHPITLKAELQGAETDPWGNDRVGLEITGQLKRSDWGMKFNQALGSGNLVVSDTVKIALDVSAIKQAQ